MLKIISLVNDLFKKEVDHHTYGIFKPSAMHNDDGTR